jgi:hypothetical protein
VVKEKSGKIRHFQGFKTGNLTLFFADVFAPNSHPIGQTLGMVGLPDKVSLSLNYLIIAPLVHGTNKDK